MTEPTAFPPGAPDDGLVPLRDRVLRVLEEGGAEPQIDEDGDIRVVINERLLFVKCAEGQVSALRVFGQWQLPEPSGVEHPDVERLDLLEVTNELNLLLNLAKLALHEQTLYVAVDMLITDPRVLHELLGNAFGAVLGAVRYWYERTTGEVVGEDDVEG